MPLDAALAVTAPTPVVAVLAAPPTPEEPEDTLDDVVAPPTPLPDDPLDDPLLDEVLPGAALPSGYWGLRQIGPYLVSVHLSFAFLQSA